MTVQDMIIAIYEGLGEPSDLVPYTDINDTSTFSISTGGAQKILKWINRGYRRILGWKFPDGSQIRFDSLMKHTYKILATTSLGLASSGSGNTITLANSITADDYVNDLTFKVTDGTGEGQTGLIVDSTQAGVLTVFPELDTSLDATSEITVYPRVVKLTDSSFQYKLSLGTLSNWLSILRISNIDTGDPLNKQGRTDPIISSWNTFGVPTSWTFYENAIYFNSNPDDDLGIKVDYMQLASDLSAATDEPDIPSIWHEAIVLWCLWWGYKRAMETDAAYSTKRDLIDYMQTTKQQIETSFELQDGQLDLEY